jgi:hypothetical protein
MAAVEAARLLSLPQAVNATELVATKVVIANTTAADVLATPRLTHLAFSAHSRRHSGTGGDLLEGGCQVTRQVCSGGGQTHPYPVNVR